MVAYLAAAWGLLIAIAADADPAAGAAVAVAALYTTIPLVAFARWRGWPFHPGRWFRLLVVRPFWYIQLLLPLVAASAAVGLLAGLPMGDGFSAARALAGTVLTACTLVLVAGYRGAHHLVVRHVDAVLPALPAAFDGLRIAQLSDLHVGPHTSRRFLRRVLATTQRLAPDVIVITGDLVDDRVEDVAPLHSALGALRAPLGTFLIPGNHDVYAGWDGVETALRAAGMGTPLVNESHLLRRGDAVLALAGTGDPAAGPPGRSRAAPDVERALADVPRGVPVVALAHNPSLFPALAQRGVALTLSGHTHWGQLAFPTREWSLASPFLERAMGGHQLGDALLYIAPGTGYWGIPFRLGAHPEVTLLTLRAGGSASLVVGAAERVRRPG